MLGIIDLRSINDSNNGVSAQSAYAHRKVGNRHKQKPSYRVDSLLLEIVPGRHVLK